MIGQAFFCPSLDLSHTPHLCMDLISTKIKREICVSSSGFIIRSKCHEIAEGFRFMPLSLVRLRTFRLSTWVGWV